MSLAYNFKLNCYACHISFSEFAKEKARQTKSGKFQKVREKHLVDEAVKGYLDWIQQAGAKYCVSINIFFYRISWKQRIS